MADNNSDYKKKNFNLNDFLPATNKGEFLESLNKNLFNRYLTKDEFDHIVGLIGDLDPNDPLTKQVKERSSYRQNNQLQPVVTQKVGSVNHFMSFEDFMTRIGRTGVDTEKFDEWGEVLQFNWVPPIDLDKIVNYRDYYWNANEGNSVPQYIVIKNQKNWAQARYKQALKTVVEVAGIVPISGFDDGAQKLYFNGNHVSEYVSGEHLVLSQADGTYQFLTISNAVFNIAAARTEVTTLEPFNVAPNNSLSAAISHVETPVLSISERVVRISGDYSNLFIEGYVIGVNSTPTRVYEVEDSSYDAVTDVTSVTIKDLDINSFNKLSLQPVISLMMAEAEVNANTEVSFPSGAWNDNNVGKLLWYRNTELTTGSYGETLLGSNLLEDTTKDFTVFNIGNGDILQIIEGVKNSGTYDIGSVTATTISVNNGQFFTASNIEYRVLRPFSLESIKTPSVSPSLYELWYDVVNDSIKQWDGSTWNTVYVGLSKLDGLVNTRIVTNYSNKNDWSDDNTWTHSSQINDFTGMIRAQMPIIEYFPYLDLSETSHTELVWRYRKDANSSYVDSDVEPKMMELLDFTYTGSEFSFISGTTIRFDEKYGNFVSDLKVGDKITLSGFALNDGTYTVASTQYLQPSPGERFVSEITLTVPLTSSADLPIGANIRPQLTAHGDLFTGLSAKHWEYGGIKEVRASSLAPTVNPMLGINVGTGSSNGFEWILGLYSQTYSLTGSVPVEEPTILFDETLHDLVLYDDYQEGDIRVYVNGERVYGVFEDLESWVDNDYVGGIKFVNGYTILPNDVIRVELGEYAADEIGRRAVSVNTPIGYELTNLAKIRRIEQRKSDSNQYPFFALRDIYGNRLDIATSIFKYAESEDAPINPNILKRVVSTADGSDYTFVQELKDPNTGRLYCYYDYQRVGDELQTIWKHGTYSERYVPTKIDGTWEMPNQWYYNISHDNYTEVKLTEIFRHFKSIIDQQEQPGLFSKSSGLFFLDDDINYGVGGTIKEHNDGFDTLISSIFINNGSPVNVIDFAKNEYDSQIRYVQERFYQEAASLFSSDVSDVNELQDAITEALINLVENNGKFDQWFGDSTSFDNGIGVRNWIATLPQFNLVPRVTPFLVKDSTIGVYDVRAHDGHVIDVAFNPAITEQLIRRITSGNKSINQIVSCSNAPMPSFYAPSIKTEPQAGYNCSTTPSFVSIPSSGTELETGFYLIRTDTTARTRKLYRFSENDEWELVDVNAIFANAILEIESRLYDVAPTTFNSAYDLESIETHPEFDRLLEEQFLEYTRRQGISAPLYNGDRFRQNNPFTWNYYHSPIPNDPLTGGISYNTAGTWQALYENVFGTAYPHLEPWVLQGYVDKPDWWDSEYADTTGTRRWTSQMWDNIFDGIIPVGKITPMGTTGTGVADQIVERFAFIPVNIDSSDTDDGYAPDSILPPYWNSINTNNSRVRGLYDPNAGHSVTTPQLDFDFGQNGLVEWEWRKSISYNYDRLIVAYKLDPMKFIHRTFGNEYQIVSCLQINKETEKVFSHSDTIFHGDFLNELKDVYKSRGLNQWYVHYQRYRGYDGVSSEFRSLWKDWNTDLSYLVGAFLDTPSFTIESDYFDITTKDYEIAVKKTKGIADEWLTSLTATVLNVPSQYAKLRDQGIGWTVEISNNSPTALPIQYHPVQNYSVNMNRGNDPFRIYSYPLKGAEISPSRGYQVIEYNSPVALSSDTGLDPNSTYTFEVILNQTDAESVSIDGFLAQTFGELFDALIDAIGNGISFGIENGNVVVYSTATTPNTEVDITDYNIFSNTLGFVQVGPSSTTANKFGGAFRIDGNFCTTFSDAGKIVVTDSSTFNGVYTIDKVYYDAQKYQTMIFIKEPVTLPATGDVVVDGIIEPENAKTLPPEWVTGTMVYFNTVGYLPNNFDDEIPYYLIRISDREFRVAETKDAALKGVYITPTSGAMGEVFVGKIDMTFQALGGVPTKYNWRTHAVDTRYVDTSRGNLMISGIQQIVDFLTGYDAYTQTRGFRYRNVNGENYDTATGMNNNWHTETEKFIGWLYALRNFRQETMLSYKVTANSSNDTFMVANGSVPNWETGTAVVLLADEGSRLPAEFDNPLSSTIPYYVIRIQDSSTEFRLAATEYDAKRGNSIPFTDNGEGQFRVQVYKAVAQYPSYELNPFKHYIWVRHEQGVLANVLDDDYTDESSAARLFDNEGLELTTADVLVFREDKESRISLTEDRIATNRALEAQNKPTKHIAGMRLFFDGYEHIIRFNDYSVDNTLIYDSFLGLNTPRFFVEFDRQQDFTLRPNVGGFYKNGDSLVQNFESTVNDMRYYYDSVIGKEGRITTDLVRKSLGYDGPKDYLSDLKINAKTQFQFWQAMIQNKGTNRAVRAFTNHARFESAEVDEFWTYKIAEFGDAKERHYVEMKLFPTDVVNNDLRIEFIAPENTAIDETFTPVALTDMNRWWNQPDQMAAMKPYEAFFFNTKITNIIGNIAESVIRLDDGKIVYVFDEFVDSVIITYFDPADESTKTLTENIEYRFLNSKVIEFLTEPAAFLDLTISVLSYDYDAQNPAKLIDKDAGTVIATVPIWHPAIGQYYNVPFYAVNIRSDSDPAIYTNSMDGGNTGSATWKRNHVGEVWMDSKLEQYIPYFDRTVFPSVNDRINNWGKLADWADIELYQWTESLIAPEDYDELAERQSFDMTIPDAEKVTGSVYKLLYQNVNFDNPDGEELEPFWIKVEDSHFDFIAGLVSLSGVDTTIAGKTAEVYINGKFRENLTFEDASSVNAYFSTFRFGDYCHVIVRAHVPTEYELREGAYMYHTPHTVEKRFDVKSGETYNVYYYWVKDKKQPISNVNRSVSLYSAKRQMVDMSEPYMILEGVRTPDFGYGLVFGHVFDEFAYNLPYRYTRMIAKGLQGTVKDNNRTVFRFTRDFTLRDKLDETNIVRKNVHEEWKLFREHQLEKIDRYLWNKVTEALVGYKLNADATAVTSVAVPSLNRVLFDRIYKADTQYGLGEDQVFTNKDLSRETIIAVLRDPTRSYEYVNIEEFLERHDFSTPEDIIAAMNEIYTNFAVSEVNAIFFAVLHDAMSLKKEHSEIFKTSWVALQISQNVLPSIPMPYDELRLVRGPDCAGPPPPPPPSPTPTTTPQISPTPSVTPSETPVPTPTVTPTPSMVPVEGCGTDEFDRIVEDNEGRVTEDDECRSIEPISNEEPPTFIGVYGER